MSIKSDNWIRRMAGEHGMIEPFAAEQVRHVDGRKIVSYGTSSYGYDVRCAPEFKIFTNINSTIVDPKQFDEKSFVDLSADVCIIPPNSFALARTVEYFRIPRSVLTVCLGKCLTGDTRVVDADSGDYLPISQMRFGRRTLALDGWELRPAAVSAVMAQGRKPVLELRTRAGLRIKATANHPFRQFYGWTALEHLKPGDRIAIARSVPVFGRTPLPRWEAHLLGLMGAAAQCCTPGHSPTFTSEDPVLVAMLQQSVLEGELGQVSPQGHLGYRIVNRIGRGGIAAPNRATLWLKKHGLAVGAGEKFVPACVFRAPRADVRAFLQALFAGDGGLYRRGGGVFLEYYSQSRRLIEDVHHLLLRFGIFGLIREKTTAIGRRACSILITDIEQILRFDREVGFVAGCIKQRRLEEYRAQLSAQGRRRSNFATLPNESLLQWQLSACGAGRTLNSIDVSPPGLQSVSLKAPARVVEAARDPEITGLATGPMWDVVSEIVPAGEEETYDISVPWLHNFVANDMLVHNSTYARCGIIVNVTPLEPEWEGHVTLEFSNTTPLPAKIYANEGVAQMLFFESDEVCSTSYRDRGGKYMGQLGVTLPKT